VVRIDPVLHRTGPELGPPLRLHSLEVVLPAPRKSGLTKSGDSAYNLRSTYPENPIMRLIPLCLLSLLSVSAVAQDGEKVTLEWKLKKGDQHRYEATQVMELDAGGNEITVEMLFGLAMEVADVSADGVARLKVTYDRVRFAMSGGPMAVDYDSDKDKKAEDVDPTGRIMAGLLNKSFTLDLSRKGECLKVEGHTKIVEDAVKDLPEDMPMAEMITENMKKQFGDENIKNGFQLILGFSPRGPVARAETWTTKHSTDNLFGKMAFDVTSTLKEIRAEGKEAVVKSDAKIAVTPSPDAGMLGAMEVTDSKMKSECVWRVGEGILESSSGTLTLDGTAGGVEIAIVQKLKLKLSPKAKK
jgi:hypothetical protein